MAQLKSGSTSGGVEITAQGNTFNGNSQLVVLNETGQLPAVDGSLITNLPLGVSSLSALTDTTIGTPGEGNILKYASGFWINSTPETTTRQGFTATASQTTFTATYNSSSIDVYLEGIKLNPNEYTATNGTSLVMNEGVSEGSYLEIISNNSAGSTVGLTDWLDITNKPTTIVGYGITDAFDGSWSSLTSTPTTIAGYGITDAFDGSWSSLTSTPTTIAGYGITDIEANKIIKCMGSSTSQNLSGNNANADMFIVAPSVNLYDTDTFLFNPNSQTNITEIKVLSAGRYRIHAHAEYTNTDAGRVSFKAVAKINAVEQPDSAGQCYGRGSAYGGIINFSADGIYELAVNDIITYNVKIIDQDTATSLAKTTTACSISIEKI